MKPTNANATTREEIHAAIADAVRLHVESPEVREYLRNGGSQLGREEESDIIAATLGREWLDDEGVRSLIQSEWGSWTDLYATDDESDDESEDDAEIENALENSGYNWTDCEDGEYHVRLPDTEEGEGDEALADLRSYLPPGWVAEWTGSGNSPGDGTTVSDACVRRK